MKLLSRVRRLFSPERKPVLGSRLIRARYDAAQDSRDNTHHWENADGLSAAAANSPEIRRKLRNRARYETANNTYACGMIRTLANDTIGTGPALQMLSGNDEADSVVEQAFYDWSQEIRLADKLRCMRMARTVDGESFAKLFINPRIRNPIQWDLRLYEAEQIARPFADLADEQLTDGIQLDQYGNVEFYHVLKQHPGDFGAFPAAFESEPVSAEMMIHLFRRERPGQVRGVPEIMSALPLYAMLRRYTLAVIQAAEIAADLAGILETNNSAIDPDEVEALDLFDLERGTLMTSPRGWKMNQLKAEQPATTYAMFKREIINEIARCLMMPFNVAAGDSAGYNYASGRLDHKVYFKAIGVDRSYTESDALDSHIFRQWWRLGVLLRRAGEPSPVPVALMEHDTPPPHEWRWPGDEHVDPQKEANAAVTLVDGGLLTEAEYQSRRGKDWEDQQKQRAKELGISVDELRELKRNKIYQSAAVAESESFEDEEEDGDE